MSEIVQFARKRKNIVYVNYVQKRFKHSQNGQQWIVCLLGAFMGIGTLGYSLRWDTEPVQ